MTSASALAPRAATQTSSQDCALSIATLRSRVTTKVGNLRQILDNAAPRGFAATINAAMDWRAERRPRELHGVERISLDTLIGDMELHAAQGRQEALDQIVDALLDGLLSASVPVTAGSVIRVFDVRGQLRLRFGR